MSSTFLTGRTVTSGKANHGKEFNEFARIEGLGPAMRRWLREAFNVKTLEDLAHLSINRVLSNPALSQLKETDKVVCCRKLEHWIKQAEEFVAQKTNWQTFTTFVVSLQARQIGGQTEQRTTAYCLETDRSVIWAGIECNAVYEMMLDQLRQVVQLQPETVTKTEPEAISKMEPELTPAIETENKDEAELTCPERLSEETVFVLEDADLETSIEPELAVQPAAIAQDKSGLEAPSPELALPQTASYEVKAKAVNQAAEELEEEINNEEINNEVEEELKELEEELNGLDEELEEELEELEEEISKGVDKNAAPGEPLLQPNPVFANVMRQSGNTALSTSSTKSVVESSAVESDNQPELEDTSPLVLEITEIKVWQPAKMEKPTSEKSKSRKSKSRKSKSEACEPEKAITANLAKRSLPGLIQQAKPFDLEVTFQITGSGAMDLTREQLHYHSEAYIRDYTTGKTVSLGRSAAQTLVAEELTYTSRFTNISFQNPGSYRLQVVTKLDRGYASPVFLELPFVQVI